jgi:hypothetical protein
VAIDILFPSFNKWLEEKEVIVKNNRPIRIWMGILLAVFCLTYIGVSIRNGVIEVKEHSPIYQAQMLAEEADYSRQMEIKEHVLNFCPDLREYASRCAKGDTDDTAPTYAESYTARINEAMKSLNSEGVYSTNMETIFDRHKTVATPKDIATNLFEIASEFEKMANQLPKQIKNK